MASLVYYNYTRIFPYYLKTMEIFSHLVEKLKESDASFFGEQPVLLDVGCDDGEMTRCLADEIKDITNLEPRVYCIDTSSNPEIHTYMAGTNYTYAVGNGFDSDIAFTFDVESRDFSPHIVTGVNVLTDSKDPKTDMGSLIDIARRPNSLVFTSSWDRNGKDGLAKLRRDLEKTEKFHKARGLIDMNIVSRKVDMGFQEIDISQAKRGISCTSFKCRILPELPEINEQTWQRIDELMSLDRELTEADLNNDPTGAARLYMVFMQLLPMELKDHPYKQELIEVVKNHFAGRDKDQALYYDMEIILVPNKSMPFPQKEIIKGCAEEFRSRINNV